MMAVATFTKSGTKSSTPAKLSKSIFGLEAANHQLLKDAYLAYLANGRANLAVTKSRGMVRGGGQKPWRQKGTGRARFGSRRNPIWRGGGVAFGPTGAENFTRKLSQRTKREALRQALSLAAKDDKVIVIESFDCPEGKVKETLSLLKKIDAKGNALIVVSQKDGLVERATRNIPTVKAVDAKYLTVFDVLNTDNLIVSKKALEVIDQWLGEKASASEGVK